MAHFTFIANFIVIQETMDHVSDIVAEHFSDIVAEHPSDTTCMLTTRKYSALTSRKKGENLSCVNRFLIAEQLSPYFGSRAKF